MADANEPLTLHGAAVALRSGAVTARKLLEQCLARAERYEPAVKAWALLDADGAREQADRLDAELRKGHARSQLHGIPVGVKDIIDVAGLPTRHGVDWLDAEPVAADAPAVARLREAGAVILGKTVTTPFAYLDPPPTRNPWDLSRTPGGSSSGSAAAVACGTCLVALGTQTGGSLARPATYCGINSYKPTHGLIPSDGVLPLAPALDHVGIIARSVAGLSAAFAAIAGPRRPGPRGGGELEGLSALAGPAPQAGNVVHGLFARFEERLTRGGGWPRVGVPKSFARLPEANRVLYASEAARVHGERFDAHADRYPPKLRELVESGRRVTAEEVSAALALRDELAAWLRPGRWLVLPATEDLPPGAETTGGASMNAPWSFLGVPAVSLSVGKHGGLPYGVQLVGARGSDYALLGVAAMVEQAAGDPHPLPPVPGERE